MAKTAFFKYEGLGNDFILFNQIPDLTARQIQQICDRHHGIGADGIIFVFLGKIWTMKVYNADGSLAEMCGNGIRCVAQWLLDQGHQVSQIQTDAGIKTCEYVLGHWAVDMGIAQINQNRVSMGNPHLVLTGPVLPEKIDPNVNTEFVHIHSPTNIDVRIFERGVGETEACGTGACASVAYFVSQKQLLENTEITVHLKGGNLYITARQTADGLQIQMRGPARYAFEGEVYTDEYL
jgi:diaminopimelate epimerase